MVIHKIDQRTEEWHQIKLGKFSASTFAKLMGKKENKGYTDELYRVAYEKLTGEHIFTYVNGAMQNGIDLEPEAQMYYEGLRNDFIEEVGFIEMNEWVGVSPDGLVNGDGLLEIKCPQWNTQIDYLLKGKLPSQYKWQVQGQLWVSERKWCDFLSYHPKLDKLLIRVNRDEKAIKELETRINEAIEETKEIIKKLEK